MRAFENFVHLSMQYFSTQRQHAIRMYRSALSVYKGHAWNYISDHVHFNIGRYAGISFFYYMHDDFIFSGIYNLFLIHEIQVVCFSWDF